MTPEAAAEEEYPIWEEDSNLMASYLKAKQEAFIAGHKSRDPEVERLVEALREIVHRKEPLTKQLISKAKEALKQYQK